MAVRAHVRGQCLLLLLQLCCLLAVSGNRRPDYRHNSYGHDLYGGRAYGRFNPQYGRFNPNVYRRHNRPCEALEARMVYLLGQLHTYDCQSYCGSEGGGEECRPASDSCTEVAGLCKRGEQCCSQTTQATTTGGLQCNFGSFHCVERETCEDLQFGSVQPGFGGCTGSQVCCNAACPILQAPPPGAPPGTMFAQCSQSGQCDPAGDYPTLKTGYICLGSNTQVCCLVRVN